MRKEGDDNTFATETDLIIEYLNQARNNSTVLINLIDRLYWKPKPMMEEQTDSEDSITSVIII